MEKFIVIPWMGNNQAVSSIYSDKQEFVKRIALFHTEYIFMGLKSFWPITPNLQPLPARTVLRGPRPTASIGCTSKSLRLAYQLLHAFNYLQVILPVRSDLVWTVCSGVAPLCWRGMAGILHKKTVGKKSLKAFVHVFGAEYRFFTSCMPHMIITVVPAMTSLITTNPTFGAL